ncbi:MAG: ribonuclease H family protein, partial [Rothia sp. (in: high G+C Gram-positive bacteria)]|uniref:ribonuclease H family protein n=1 Tax=Rothia sp. (in: high G+C Gram-positive bacteria) TaxID=1885016 RepID=UPI0026DFC8DB
MAKQKYYVVWRGTVPGIYSTWAECEQQVKGIAGSAFKSFETQAEAEQAYAAGAPTPRPQKETVSTKPSTTPKASPAQALQNPPDYRHDTVLPLPMEVTADAWAVDAACSGNPGQMEYRGVDLATGAEIFH